MSLEKQRTQQLLQAFIECIPEYGLDGTTLEHVAEKAGMTRSLIRHYIGNRDLLMSKLIDTIIQNTQEEINRALTLPTTNRMERLLNALFEPRELQTTDKLVLNELINARERFPEIQKKIADLFERILEQISQEILLEYPHIQKNEAQKVAYTLFCISLSQDSMVWLGINPTFTGFGPEMAGHILKSLDIVEDK